VLVITMLFGHAHADTGTDGQVGKGVSRALIIVGLPGDDAHDKQFLRLGNQYRDWLTKSAGFDAGEVRLLVGRKNRDEKEGPVATRESILKTAAELKQVAKAEDRLWVFFIGHGSWDGDNASFHLPGPDIKDHELGKAFRELPGREQVFWLTGSASGQFLKQLSAKGRIVITATEPDSELNETEFPEAFADVISRPLKELDTNQDGQLSVLELYRHTYKEVMDRFAKDKRAPTEHPRLDDNGDGIGTEEIVLVGNKEEKKPTADGALAAKTRVGN
jgi:hypothetical protein